MLGLDPSIHTAQAIDQNGVFFEAERFGLDPRVKPEDDAEQDGRFIEMLKPGPRGPGSLMLA